MVRGNGHEQEQAGRGERAEAAKSETIRRIQRGAKGQRGPQTLGQTDCTEGCSSFSLQLSPSEPLAVGLPH